MACGKLKSYLTANFDRSLASNSCIPSLYILGFEHVAGYSVHKNVMGDKLNYHHYVSKPKWSQSSVWVFSLTVNTFRFLRSSVKNLSASTTYSSYQWSLSVSQYFRRLVLLSRVPTLTSIPKRLLAYQPI